MHEPFVQISILNTFFLATFQTINSINLLKKRNTKNGLQKFFFFKGYTRQKVTWPLIYNGCLEGHELSVSFWENFRNLAGAILLMERKKKSARPDMVQVNPVNNLIFTICIYVAAI